MREDARGLIEPPILWRLTLKITITADPTTAGINAFKESKVRADEAGIALPVGSAFGRPFAEFFIALLGNYREHIRRNPETKELELDRETFVASHPRSHQPFLRAVIGSQAFQQFIVERQADLGVGRVISGHFERLLQVPHRGSMSHRNASRGSPVLLRRHLPVVRAAHAAAAAKESAEADEILRGSTPFDTGLATPARSRNGSRVAVMAGGSSLGTSDQNSAQDTTAAAAADLPLPPLPSTPSNTAASADAGSAPASPSATPTPTTPAPGTPDKHTARGGGARSAGESATTPQATTPARASTPVLPSTPEPAQTPASSAGTPRRAPNTPSASAASVRTADGSVKTSSMNFQLLQLSSPSAASVDDLADAVRLEEEHFQKDNAADIKQTSRVRKLAEKLDNLQPVAVQYVVDAKTLEARIIAVQEAEEPADGEGAQDDDGNSVRAAVNKLEKKLNAAVDVAKRCALASSKHAVLGEAVQLTTALVRLKQQHGDAINCVAGGLASVQGNSTKKKSFWKVGRSKFERDLFDQLFALLAEVEAVGRAHGRARARQNACIKHTSKDLDVITGAATSIASFSGKLAFLERRVGIEAPLAGGSDGGAAGGSGAGLSAVPVPSIDVACIDGAPTPQAVSHGEENGNGAVPTAREGGAARDGAPTASTPPRGGAAGSAAFDDGSSAPGSPASPSALNGSSDEIANLNRSMTSPVHSAAANAAAVLVGAGGSNVLPSEVVTTSCYMGAQIPAIAEEDADGTEDTDDVGSTMAAAGPATAAAAGGGATTVTKETFDAFVADVVCPKFDSFSISTQTGFWKGQREETFVLTVIHAEGDATITKLNEVAAIYKDRFNQEEVLINSLASPGQ